jgi:hypothetical protein
MWAAEDQTLREKNKEQSEDNVDPRSAFDFAIKAAAALPTHACLFPADSLESPMRIPIHQKEERKR